MEECRMTEIPAIDIQIPTTEDPKGKGVQDKETKVKKETESVGDDMPEDPKGKGVHDQVLPDAIVTESVRDDVRQDSKGKGVHDQVLPDAIVTESVRDDVRQDSKGKGVHDEDRTAQMEIADYEVMDKDHVMVIPDTPEKYYPGESCVEPPEQSSKSPMSNEPKRRRLRATLQDREKANERFANKKKMFANFCGSVPPNKVGRPELVRYKFRSDSKLPLILLPSSIKASKLAIKHHRIMRSYVKGGNKEKLEAELKAATVDNLTDSALSGTESAEDPAPGHSIMQMGTEYDPGEEEKQCEVHSTHERRLYVKPDTLRQVEARLKDSHNYDPKSFCGGRAKQTAMLREAIEKFNAAKEFQDPSETGSEDMEDAWSGDESFAVADDPDCAHTLQYAEARAAQEQKEEIKFEGPVSSHMKRLSFLKTLDTLPECSVPESVFVQVAAGVKAAQEIKMAERLQQQAMLTATGAPSLEANSQQHSV